MKSATQLILEMGHKPNYSEQDFIEGPCNWEAYQWVKNWPDWPIRMITIYGEPGCGKTHLAHIWQAKSKARYLTPSETMLLSPDEAIGQDKAIVLEDAERILLSVNEDWMFHFYNLAKEKGVDLFICSRQPPTQWSVELPDLRSRLSTILSIEVQTPDEETLCAVLLKLTHERGMTMSIEIADYILRRVERSFKGIQDIVRILDHKSLTLHRQLTLGLVREALNDFTLEIESTEP